MMKLVILNTIAEYKMRGNYLQSEAGSRDSLKDLIINNMEEIIEYLIELTDKGSFWIACLGCIYNIWIYCATHNRKYSNRITVLILTYVFIQMIVSVIKG